MIKKIKIIKMMNFLMKKIMNFRIQLDNNKQIKINSHNLIKLLTKIKKLELEKVIYFI